MSDWITSPNGLLFPFFVGLSLWLVWQATMWLWVRAVIQKTIRISGDVGVHIKDLLGVSRHEDALAVILRGIADENYLLAMRALRCAEQAARSGHPDAADIIAALQKHLDDHGTCPHIVFHGFSIPVPSFLATRFPVETATHNARTARLREHWLWASDWLWRYRFNTPRP